MCSLLESISLDPKIYIPETLQFIATVWIAIVLQKAANRSARKSAEGTQAVRILKEIIGRADDVQSLLVGFPLTARVRDIIARKIESAVQNADMLRFAKDLISHPDFEMLADAVTEAVLQFESLTNEFAGMDSPVEDEWETQRQMHSDLVLACNQAIMTLSLS